MTFTAITIAALLLEALPLQAQERQQEQTAQEGRRVHVVREGDTLWDLASFYLSDPFLWPEIYRINTVVVEDPHWIYPAEELVLPGPGEVVREPGEEPVPVPEVEVEPRPQEPVLLPEEQPRTVFAARELTQQTLTYQPLPPVPAIAVSSFDFHRAAMLLQLDELGARGRVVDVTQPPGFHVVQLSTIPRYGRIYVSHLDDEAPEPGDRILLYRVERQIKPYGHVVRPTGLATIAAVHEDVSTAVIVEVYDRVMVGDQTKKVDPFDFEAGVFAEPIAAGPTGELVALLDEQRVPSEEDLVFVDVGRSQGVVIGDEFELYSAARRKDGLRLPEEHIGTGRVVRVTEETATVRVIEMRHPTIDVGVPVRLVRKMPS